MAGHYHTDSGEEAARHHTYEQEQQLERPEQQSEELEPSWPSHHIIDLLHDPHLNEHGNTPVRAETLRSAERTHGNHAVQRFIQRAMAPGHYGMSTLLSVQRQGDLGSPSSEPEPEPATDPWVRPTWPSPQLPEEPEPITKPYTPPEPIPNFGQPRYGPGGEPLTQPSPGVIPRPIPGGKPPTLEPGPGIEPGGVPMDPLLPILLAHDLNLPRAATEVVGDVDTGLTQVAKSTGLMQGKAQRFGTNEGGSQPTALMSMADWAGEHPWAAAGIGALAAPVALPLLAGPVLGAFGPAMVARGIYDLFTDPERPAAPNPNAQA